MDQQFPLVVDLDGTLLKSDLLAETGLLYLRDQPHFWFAPLQWLLRGKVELKQQLAARTELDTSVLPYDDAVIELIGAERQRGRKVILATASHHSLAQRVADHLRCFDDVIATRDDTNLSAERKRDALVQRFGEGGFDYAGNSADDLPVWKAARQAYVVNASASVERRARSHGNVAGIISGRRAGLRDWAKALRLHQWLKNLLVFVPLLTSHRYTEPSLFLQVLLAFLCFGLCASSVYLLNDLLDLQDDRHHASKRHRPFAAGTIPLQLGLLLFPLLLLAAFALALWQLPWLFSVGLAAYYIMTLAYSLVLKRRMMLDVITLAGLYTVRIIVGALAVAIPLSFWLLAFSMFIFLSLALVKRYAELFDARARGSVEKSRGRGYYPDDLEMISSLGAASGYISVMVMALYVNDARNAVLYTHHQLLWLVCPLLLFWIGRIWMLAHRGKMHDDPVIFAARDRVSLIIGLACAIIFWAAT